MNNFLLFVLCLPLFLGKYIESTNVSETLIKLNFEHDENSELAIESTNNSISKSERLDNYLSYLIIDSVTENSVNISYYGNKLENNFKYNLSVLQLNRSENVLNIYSKVITKTPIKVEGLIPGAKYIAHLDIYGKQTNLFQLEKKFVTKPTLQINLTSIERGKTSILLNWTEYGGLYDGYKIIWSRKQCITYDYEYECPDVDVIEKFIDKYNNSYKFTNLYPGALYKVQLFRTSIIDQTREYSKGLLYLITTMPYPPSNVLLDKDSIKPNSFGIYWDKPNQSCEFSEYNVKYRQDHSLILKSEFIKKGNEDRIYYTASENINPGETYHIFVTTVSKIRHYKDYSAASKSISIKVTTRPLPVVNIRVNKLSNSEICVDWTPDIESTQDSYLVKYYIESDPENKFNQTITNSSIILKDLLQDNEYIIEVFAISKGVVSKKNWTSILIGNVNMLLNYNWLTYLLIILTIVISIIFIMLYISIKSHNPRRKSLINPIYQQVEKGKLIEANQDIQGISIKPEDLKILQKLGQGQFGTVHYGYVIMRTGLLLKKVDVAIKMPNRDNKTDKIDIKSIIQEALLMKGFDHENVLSLIGISVTSDGYPSIVLPFMENGDLLAYLRKAKNESPTKILNKFLLDAVKGMEYLANNKFVHRDLAARNCMLDQDLTLKIADFGLTRHLITRDYYRSNRSKYVPLRWMAIESITKNKFTEQSDVWSFGILVWEVFTNGSIPYAHLKDKQVLEYIQKGNRLQKPDKCPQIIYDVVQECWAGNHEDRPSFSDLQQKLNIINKNLYTFPVCDKVVKSFIPYTDIK